MGRSVKGLGDERGVTLIELLAASTILALVITGICLWINQMWDSTKATQTASMNQQQATTIMSQLLQQIHNAQVDAKGNYVTIAGSEVTIATSSGFVSYSKQDNAIVYTNPANQHIVLADEGDLQVQTADQKTFAITLTVGAADDPNRVVQTTRVARYDWGK